MPSGCARWGEGAVAAFELLGTAAVDIWSVLISVDHRNHQKTNREHGHQLP
jgi:hypothetical protein